MKNVVFTSVLLLLVLVGFLTQPVLSVNVEEGLVVYWSFDEGSGNIASDLSGNGHDGVLIEPQWTDGKFGGDILRCPRELRLLTTTALNRDSEIARTRTLSYYFQC